MIKENKTIVFNEEDIAKICEVAVILTSHGVVADDLHDFYENHVKPIYLDWLNETGDFADEDERAYITEYANGVALRNYK